METLPNSLLAERTLGVEVGRAGIDRSFVRVVAASLVVHMVILFAALRASTTSDGGGAVELETISVTIVTDRELAVPLAATSGLEPSIVEPPLDKPPPVSDPTPAPAEEAKAETAMPDSIQFSAPAEPPREEQSKAVADPEATKAEAAKPAAAPPASQAPLSIGGQSSDEASASRGEIDWHAREVALVLARHRPKGIGAKGRVVVEFRLSPEDGTLIDVRVTSSSGNNRLDRTAVTTVELGKYPRPPNGMRAEQLTFRIPFQFD